jgi:hypothetical protein
MAEVPGPGRSEQDTTRHGMTELPPDGGADGPIIIANEFADVVVSRVRTRNGMRLEIWSPRRGTRVHLDAVALDCLSYQAPETFTAMLERTPGG